MKRNKVLLVLLFIAGLCLYFSCGRLANIFIDVGREMYYPLEILRGKVLYKDLFCIYGPLSYLFNAFLYKIFGARLFSLYLGGTISALLIVCLIYKISKKFLEEITSFLITLFVIVTACLSVRIFNFTLPYAYAVLYGMVCFLVSVFFLINFAENTKKYNLYIAAFFAGFAISNKYDFILYFIPLTIVILKTKNLKLILESYLAFFIAAFAPFVILFIQGLNLNDLINTFVAIQQFTSTEALKTFYVTQGVYYTNKLWTIWGILLFYHSIMAGIIYLGLKIKETGKKFSGMALIASGIILIVLFANIEAYLFLTFLVFVLFIFSFKKNTFIKNIFIISSLLVSLKSLWGLSHVNYGIYYAGVILISFFVLISQIFNKKTEYMFNLILTGLIINYFITGISNVSAINYKVSTNKGNLYTIKKFQTAADELISYIDNIKEEKPKIVIYPEGLSINFLASKETETEGFYNSLIPLYTEGFGEKKIIENLEKTKPDYVIFSNLQSLSYNKRGICVDYALDICNYVYANYLPVKKIETEKEIYIVLKK